MAPKGDGGSGRSGSSSLDDSPWGKKVKFNGSHFHDPNIRAFIINYGMCFVATVGIAIWAIVVRKNSRPLRMGHFGIFDLYVHYSYLGNNFALFLLYDQQATVRVVYWLVATILDSSNYLADISLLGFIYVVVAACLHDLRVTVAIKTALKVTSVVLTGILTAFWAAILALRIKYEVNEVTNPSEVRPDEELVWNKLEIMVYSIFVFASIELLTLAMWIVSRQRKQANPTWIGIYIASLVAIPLLIRSLFSLGFLAAGLTHYIQIEAEVAEEYITNICFVLVYIGILLVAMRFKKERAGLGHPGNFGHPQMSPGTWTYPASVQHQTYPPQGSQHGDSNHLFLSHGTAPNEGAPLGNPSYSSRKQPTDSTTVGRGYPQAPNNDAVTPYQAQNQYNEQHTPVSPVLGENSFPTITR